VIEKTRGLAFRTQALGAAMNRRASGEQEGEEGGKKQGGKGRRGGGGGGGGPHSGTGSAPAIEAEA
jgi:translation initiation factor 3 subunit E